MRGLSRYYLAALFAISLLPIWGGEVWADHSAAKAKPVIAYLTDVEGKWQKFEDFLKDNPHVYRDAHGMIRLQDGVTLVYGGDVTDTGPNNIQVLEAINDLKARYGDRVIVIAGNRDIGKLRLKNWLNDPLPPKVAERLTQRKLTDTPANRLTLFLEGAAYPGAFEDRRKELESIEGHPVSDADLVEELLKDLGPGGRTRKLLESSQLAYRNGETLIVHGAILDDNYGRVPDRPGETFSDPDQWVRELNRWYSDRVSHWIATGDAAELIAYQGPVPGTYANRESVVYGRYTDSSGRSRMPSMELRRTLMAHGVFRIVVGHTPQGDGPNLLREDGFEIIMADNTEAPHGSQIFIEGDKVEIESQVRLGARPETYHMSWRLGDDTPLGRRLISNDHVIVAKLDDGRWLAYDQGPPPNFEVTQTAYTDAEIKSIGLKSTSFDVLRCASAF